MSAPGGVNDCGCCEGLQDRTPAGIFNRPGLSAIAYRSATYGLFKQSMLAGLSRADRPALGGLRTRADDDFSIALIDAWAVAGDVLTFYIERAAQEQFLPTATERGSLDNLVQLISYRLRPGVAASTWLAFMLESMPPAANGVQPPPTPGVPERVPVPVATQVQSLPGPGEFPQTFETVAEIEALAPWNTLRPRLTAPVIPATSATDAWFAGVGLDLSPGDLLLFVADDFDPVTPGDRWDLRRVVAVTANATSQRTLVRWHGGLEDLDLDPNIPVNVFALRQRASLFGFNAPDPRLFTNEVQGNLDAAGLITDLNEDWAFPAVTDNTLFLDTAYRGIEPDGWVVVDHPDVGQTLATVLSVSDVSRAAHSISTRVTSLVLDHILEIVIDDEVTSGYGEANTRATTVLLDSQLIVLAETPIREPVSGGEIRLASVIDHIDQSRTIVVRGKQASAHRHEDHMLTITADDGAVRLPAIDDPLIVLALETEGLGSQHRWRLRTPDGFEGMATDDPAALVYQSASPSAPLIAEETLVIAVMQTPDGSILLLEQPLSHVYDRGSLEILGNVAAATHGETVRGEVLGSGDGSKPYQQFTLRKNPLTYVRGVTPGKTDSTLTIRVNGVRWQEVPTLYGQGPRGHVFTTRITDDGKTIVQFGDGESGARLPTGHDNIVATYRAGTGMEGQVDAGQLSLLMTRPLGVRSVSNPLAPIGAADRQEAEDARENAPRSVLTLERIVSLQDYEDFARDFSGIAKASAVWTWNGERRGVLITVAGIDGADVPEGELVHDDLVAGIAAASPRRVPVVVKSYRPDQFRLRAALRVHPDHEPDTVLAAVRLALAEHFAFDARSLGEIVTLSGVYAAIHQVPGIVAADIDHLYRGGDARLEPFLIAQAPSDGSPPQTLAAELLTLDTAALDDLEILS